ACCTTAETGGCGLSAVEVETITCPSSAGSRPSSARCAARTARSAVVSPAEAKRRDRIPVLATIHSGVTPAPAASSSLPTSSFGGEGPVARMPPCAPIGSAAQGAEPVLADPGAESGIRHAQARLGSQAEHADLALVLVGLHQAGGLGHLLQRIA